MSCGMRGACVARRARTLPASKVGDLIGEVAVGVHRAGDVAASLDDACACAAQQRQALHATISPFPIMQSRCCGKIPDLCTLCVCQYCVRRSLLWERSQAVYTIL